MSLAKHDRAAAARAMATQYGVSLRTAQRHLRQGTTPRADRVTGADGKSYPKPAPKPPPPPWETARLLDARTILRVLSRRPSLDENDRALVADIAKAAAAVLRSTTTARRQG